MSVSTQQLKQALEVQRSELSAYELYKYFASKEKLEKNREILEKLATVELDAYNIWKSITGQDIKSHTVKIFLFKIVSHFLGITFSVKYLERLERQHKVEGLYAELEADFPEEIQTMRAQPPHEDFLIEVLDEKRVEHMGSITLGLNDALIELTGALAGFTLALNNNKIIALTGLIMGLTASLSMAASDYLSNRNEGAENPIQSAYYTGLAYVFAVTILVLPYFIFQQPFISLVVTLLAAILIILFFTFYLSVIKGYNFRRRFIEMVLISLGIAAISFGIGYIVKLILGVDV